MRLWGSDTGLFDKWSLTHLLAGFLIGTLVTWLFTKDVGIAALTALSVSLMWELCEPFVEQWRGLGGEHWLNRWIGDHLAVTGGAAVGALYTIYV